MKKLVLIMAVLCVAAGIANALPDAGLVRVVGSDWDYVTLTSGTAYKDIASDRINDTKAYALKTDGTLDFINATGGWNAQSMGGGIAGMTFTAIDGLATIENRAWVNTTDGKVGFVYNTGVGAWSFVQVGSGSYIDIAGDKVNADKVFGLKADGSIDAFYVAGSWTKQESLGGLTGITAIDGRVGIENDLWVSKNGDVGHVYDDSGWTYGSIGIAGNYVDIASDGSNNSKIFGLKANGSIDAFYVSNGWKKQESLGGLTGFTCIDGRVGIENDVWTATIPEPATVVILALGGLLIRRKRA